MGSNPFIAGVTIRSNSAEWGGGGINIADNSHPVITDAEIVYNSTSETDGYGGGIAVEESSNPEITNVLIAGNTAYYGGACNFYLSANAALSNVTISNNSAQLHGGISSYDSEPSLVNCVLWGNSGDEIFSSAVLNNITYSNIEGGYGLFTSNYSKAFFLNIIKSD